MLSSQNSNIPRELYIHTVFAFSVYFKLFIHVSQWSLAAVPMYPSHGAHWDTLSMPIKWSSANDSAAQVPNI